MIPGEVLVVSTEVAAPVVSGVDVDEFARMHASSAVKSNALSTSHVSSGKHVTGTTTCDATHVTSAWSMMRLEL